MNKINILPPEVFNLLAAGEVVENAASIIKECVENSLDAGATKIEIHIANAGMDEITIIDNGSGVLETEVEKVFMPHSTSKVSTPSDIGKIATLGFRGEALSSIASVSKITFTTKTKDAPAAMVLTLDAGKIVPKTKAPANNGTTISIKNLFFNMPARKKFLPKTSTQRNKIIDVVDRFLLSHPGIHFILKINDEIHYDCPPAKLINRIEKLYGASIASNMLEIPMKRKDGLTISGYVSNPTASRANKTYQTTFINGRVIQGGIIAKAAGDVYAKYAPKDSYPVIVLNLQLDPTKVDVNVHPRKAEVKFEDEKTVYDFVYAEVDSAYDRHFHKKDIQFKSTISPTTTMRYFSSSSKSEMVEQPDNILNFYENQTSPNQIQPKPANPTQEEMDIETETNILGTIFGTFIVVESGDSFVMIDQHAAAERLAFDKLKKQINDRKIETQPLLSPHLLYLNPIEMTAFTEIIPNLETIGFEVAPFGNNCLRVSAVPILVAQYNVIGEVCNVLLSDLKGIRGQDLTDLVITKVTSICCRASLKAGEVLTQAQIRLFLDQFVDAPIVPTCPHGRPIFIRQTKKQLEKMFKR